MSGRIWTGVILILIGGGFLLERAGVLDFSEMLSFGWPLIVVLIGVIQLFNRNSSSVLSGLLFILIGGLFFANQWVDENLIVYLWPLILIVIGLVIMFSRSSQRKKSVSDDALQTYALFAGLEIREQSHNFKGGQVTAIFGGVDLDLRDIEIKDEKAELDLTVVFGGVKMIVPEHVQIEVTGLPIFGGFEDKTRHHSKKEATDLPVLKLNCLAVFGGIEIMD